MTWNINGWTQNNHLPRKDILSKLNADIICLTETKLRSTDTISIENYRSYLFNREHLKKTATCGSGGVAILIKDTIEENFYVTCASRTFEGILSLKLTNKLSSFEIVITVCYLPPEGSERGQHVDEFFDHLTGIVYLYSNADCLLFCGDINGRISDLNDIIVNIDNVNVRKPIDFTKNRHSESFAEFLREAKLCVLNGRISPEYDNFTSISTKGKAVVDYIFTPQSNIELFNSFEIHTVKELSHKYNIKPDCAMPDHSVLCCTMTVSTLINNTTNGANGTCTDNNNNPINGKRFNYDSIPAQFIENNTLI